MNLKEYENKRNFNSTNEPKPKVQKVNQKRFVIQYHQARAKHYDFRLEHNGVLLSWAVPKGLSLNPRVKRLAVQVEHHPIDYINFEGVIPKGNYGAGSVEIFDKGNYVALESLTKGLKEGHIKILLNGEKFKGGFSLIKTNEDNWIIIKIKDEFATSKAQPKTPKLPLKTCSPQLALLTEKIPKGKDWIFEIKYDGYRIISFVENGKVKMLTRNGLDYTKKLGKISNSLINLKQSNFIIDGEVVSFDENGKSDFGLLQRTLKGESNNLSYVIFDILALNGEDLRELPLLGRKKKLELMLAKADKNLIYSNFVRGNGKESFNFAKEKGLEGIVAKNINAKYKSERNDDWLKIKCYLRQEFVIGGFKTSSKNEDLSALLVGYYEKGKLIYAGKVGTGFNQTDRKELSEKFKKIALKTCPFKNNIEEKNVTWISPKFVAEIQFAELTKEKLLRQPSFIALRKDKEPKQVKLEFK